MLANIFFAVLIWNNFSGANFISWYPIFIIHGILLIRYLYNMSSNFHLEIYWPWQYSFCIYYTTLQITLTALETYYIVNCRKRLMRYNVQSYSYKRTTKRLESRDHNCSKHIVHSCSVIVLLTKTGFFYCRNSLIAIICRILNYHVSLCTSEKYIPYRK